jgi:uncharacterized membrane protein YidH (DUF202 family)
MEPKLFFANERTFIKWMQMAVVLSSISVGVIAFANDESKYCFCSVSFEFDL